MRRIAGRGYEEVIPAVPTLRLVRIDQPEIRFMNQRRALKGLTRMLPGELLGGQLAQLVIDQRQKLLGCLQIALLDG
jgi:hypothetical protein